MTQALTQDEKIAIKRNSMRDFRRMSKEFEIFELNSYFQHGRYYEADYTE